MKLNLKKFFMVVLCTLMVGGISTVTTEAGAGGVCKKPNTSTTNKPIVDSRRAFTVPQPNGPKFTTTDFRSDFGGDADGFDEVRFTYITVAKNDGTIAYVAYKGENYITPVNQGFQTKGTISPASLQDYFTDAMKSQNIDPDDVVAIVEYTLFTYTDDANTHIYTHIQGGWTEVDVLIRAVSADAGLGTKLTSHVFYNQP